jgi:hypothetical protein
MRQCCTVTSNLANPVDNIQAYVVQLRLNNAVIYSKVQICLIMLSVIVLLFLAISSILTLQNQWSIIEDVLELWQKY